LFHTHARTHTWAYTHAHAHTHGHTRAHTHTHTGIHARTHTAVASRVCAHSDLWASGLYYCRESIQKGGGDSGTHHSRYFTVTMTHSTQSALADVINQYWISFGATGQPKGKVTWSQYDRTSQLMLQLDAPSAGGVRSRNDIRKRQCDFWTSVMKCDACA